MKRTPLYTVARAVLPWLFRVLMPIRIRNAEFFPKNGKAVLCCNHASMTDPIRLAFCTRRQIFYMAKEELFRNRFVSLIIRSLGAFPVSRGRGDRTAIQTAQSLINDGCVLGIFIEGTRSKDGNLLRPKSGAVMLANTCQAPIVPCCITSKGGGVPRLFKPCTVTFGRPIQPLELGIQDGTPSEYRSASMKVMEQITEMRQADLKEWEHKR